MKRASYRNGIDFIAFNDKPLELDVGRTATLISVVLMSELFGVPIEEIAKQVIRKREKYLGFKKRKD